MQTAPAARILKVRGTLWPLARRFTLLVVVASLAGGASAHVPEVGPSSRDLGSTDRSWAFYDELPAGATHTWTFDLTEGSPLFVSIGVPTGASWTPQANLTGPGGPIALVRETGVALEPFAAYASLDVWSLDVPAPGSGNYSLAISGTGGRYVLGFGLTERFSIVQWVGVPWETLRIHAWQGIPWWPTALVYAGALALFTMGPPGHPRDRLLVRAGAALFAGSGADRALHLVFAAAAGAQASFGLWLLAIALVLPHAGLAWGAVRAHRPWVLAALAVAGLALWAGLFVGPGLLAAEAGRRLTKSRKAWS